MKQQLLAVIDETGTTNRPSLSDDSDFGVGVIAFKENDIERLVEVSKKIGDVVGKKDFKYKHVQRSTEARRLFLQAIKGLAEPAGVSGFFTPGGSLLREKQAALAEMEFLGTDDGGGTAEIAEAILANDSDAHFKCFLDFLAPCLISYAVSWDMELRVHWDRRTDVDQVQRICTSFNQFYRSHPHHGDVSNLVDFGHVAEGQLSAIARLSGVIAGDIKFFFKKFGPGIWDMLLAGIRLKGEFSTELIRPENMEQITLVRTVRQMVADASPEQGSSETCILQGYNKHLLAGLLSFASPQGKMGHVRVLSGHHWELHQIPD